MILFAHAIDEANFFPDSLCMMLWFYNVAHSWDHLPLIQWSHPISCCCLQASFKVFVASGAIVTASTG
jgi:hypothetical protein